MPQCAGKRFIGTQGTAGESGNGQGKVTITRKNMEPVGIWEVGIGNIMRTKSVTMASEQQVV